MQVGERVVLYGSRVTDQFCLVILKSLLIYYCVLYYIPIACTFVEPQQCLRTPTNVQNRPDDYNNIH